MIKFYNISKIRDICKTRTDFELACHNCIFYKSVCEEVKARYQIEKPADYQRGMSRKMEVLKKWQ